MQIFRTRRYQNQLISILEYIAKDKISASENFHQKLDKQIDSLVNHPFKYKRSFYSNDENVRDMTFNKYTIQYKVYQHKSSILKIFNKNKPKDITTHRSLSD